MESFITWLQTHLGIDIAFQKKIFASVSVIFILWLIRWGFLRLARRSSDPKHYYRIRKTTTYIAFTLGLLLVGDVWLEGLQSVTTFLGLLSAGLAIALKDLVSNLAGWVFLVWRRPFEVGDRVQIGANAGDVIDIRIFQFTLLEIGNWVAADQSTGRIVHLPNSRVFTDSVANYDKGFRYIWNELPVLVTFESNWKKAKAILQAIVDRHEEQLSVAAQERIREASRKFLIYYAHLTPTVYTAVEDSGVLLTIRYLTEPRKRRGTEQALWEDILEEFHRHVDIDFAYPTRRFYDNVVEGKPGLVPGTEGKGDSYRPDHLPDLPEEPGGRKDP